MIGEVAEAVREILQGIDEAYEMEIDTMEVIEGLMHVMLSAHPHYSPARVMQIMKSISARELLFVSHGSGRSCGVVSYGAMGILYGRLATK